MRTATWLLAGLMACGAAADEPKKRALLVGVNAYLKRGFPNLEFAERDATELAAALKPMGFEVRLLLGSSAGDAAATKTNIEAQIAALVADVGKEDVVLVFFAGHGQQLPSLRVTGVEDAYFCLREAESRTPATMVSLSGLTDDVLAKKGGKNLLLVDACRDTPPDPDRGARGVQGKVVALPEDTAILFACRAGQVSRENANHGGGHGLFTHAVLEGLRGRAAADGRIDWGGLVGHVGRSMRSMQAKIPAASRQEPIAAGVVGHIDLGPAPVLALADRNQADIRPEMPATKPAPTETPPQTPGGDYVSRSTGMKFKYIKVGTGVFGEDATQKEITIAKPFHLGIYTVTQAQWEKVMRTTPWKGQTNVKEGANYPATFVSWEEATDFCNKLSKADGVTYRLPTEQEWEYACRAGTTTKYSFGDDESKMGEFAWFDENAFDIGAKYAHEVGTKAPNPWGLHDMHGNVWQWTSSAYDNSDRVTRGGSWFLSAGSGRSANRYWYSPGNRYSNLGFRVVAGSMEPRK